MPSYPLLESRHLFCATFLEEQALILGHDGMDSGFDYDSETCTEPPINRDPSPLFRGTARDLCSQLELLNVAAPFLVL